MTSEIENEEKRNIPVEKYNFLVWTKHETLFRNRVALRNKALSKIFVPFTIALHVKLRRSLFGTYLKDLNENQCQNEFLNMNKLAITKTLLHNFNATQLDKFKYNSNIFDEILKYLSNTVTEREKINCEYFYEHATHLRLDDYNISMVDDGLRIFKNLQVLVICDNWISDISGSVLPRRLKFLELYVNEMESVQNLVYKAPRDLQYLGLGRNKLTNDSALHLLGEVGRLNNLKTLDLSECDIYSLIDVLTSLNKLQYLESLSLQGNPCSMIMDYTNMVLNVFPNLIFLDGVEISRSDRIFNNNFNLGVNNAELVLNCLKLTGLLKPPKVEKKVKQTIHIEYAMPLFQENTIEEIGKVTETKVKEKINERRQISAKKAAKHSLKKNSKSDAKSRYQKENEYNSRKINNCFQTRRKGWSAKMKFPPIVLKSPENNLEAYRDSFRSKVNVRVVYLEYLPPEKKKAKAAKTHKKKKAKKTKGMKKKDKSSKSNASEKSKIEEDLLKKEPEKPKETILKRITLANFYCNLFSINWKDDLQFYWSEEPSFGEKAVELQSFLNGLKKEEAEKKAKLELEKQKATEEKLKKQQEKKGGRKNKKSKHGTGGSGKADKKSNRPKKSKQTKKSKKSKSEIFLTCQISFGLTRVAQEVRNAKSTDNYNDKGSKSKKKKNPKK